MNSDSKYTVLIVDDVPENIEVISSILYQQGVDIAIAQSGRNALDRVAHRTPDLILLDINMPEMDGFEVCHALKHNPETEEIPIIFLTARDQPADIVKGFEVGAVDYITKPFRTPELIARVFTHLELKRSRDIIKAQNKELEALNAAKDKFFSLIAHDLRNPFFQLLSFSELLKDNIRSYPLEKIETYAQRMHTASQRGYNLLENLLQWARSQTGRIRFKSGHICLKEHIVESLEVLESFAKDKQITLSVEIPEDLMGFADEDMLKTIIRNLVSNAIKFTEQGGAVTISAKITGKWVGITVSDTGVGIKEEALNTLFRLDTNCSTQGTAQEKGTGLGLILCKEFVEKQGGKLWAASEVGKGCRFTFTLPITTERGNG